MPPVTELIGEFDFLFHLWNITSMEYRDNVRALESSDELAECECPSSYLRGHDLDRLSDWKQSGGNAAATAIKRISIVESNILRERTEEEGFEPPVRFPVQRFSRPPVSTTHPFLRCRAYSDEAGNSRYWIVRSFCRFGFFVVSLSGTETGSGCLIRTVPRSVLPLNVRKS